MPPQTTPPLPSEPELLDLNSVQRPRWQSQSYSTVVSTMSCQDSGLRMCCSFLPRADPYTQRLQRQPLTFTSSVLTLVFSFVQRPALTGYGPSMDLLVPKAHRRTTALVCGHTWVSTEVTLVSFVVNQCGTVDLLGVLPTSRQRRTLFSSILESMELSWFQLFLVARDLFNFASFAILTLTSPGFSGVTLGQIPGKSVESRISPTAHPQELRVP